MLLSPKHAAGSGLLGVDPAAAESFGRTTAVVRANPIRFILTCAFSVTPEMDDQVFQKRTARWIVAPKGRGSFTTLVQSNGGWSDVPNQQTIVVVLPAGEHDERQLHRCAERSYFRGEKCSHAPDQERFLRQV
jgi:hypothetical protein